jgi:hypothetical protein
MIDGVDVVVAVIDGVYVVVVVFDVVVVIVVLIDEVVVTDVEVGDKKAATSSSLFNIFILLIEGLEEEPKESDKCFLFMSKERKRKVKLRI